MEPILFVEELQSLQISSKIMIEQGIINVS